MSSVTYSLLQRLAREVLEKRESMEVKPALLKAFHEGYASEIQFSIEKIREDQRRAFEASRSVCVR